MKKSIFQFSDPQLVDLVFKINENFDNNLFEGFDLHSDVTEIVIDEDELSIVRLEVKIGDTSKKHPFYISATMSGNFSCKDKEQFKKSIKISAPAVLLSYARPIISLIVSQAGFPSFNIPFINFTDQ